MHHPTDRIALTMAFGTTVMEIAQWVHLEESIQLYEKDPECIYLCTLLYSITCRKVMWVQNSSVM